MDLLREREAAGRAAQRLKSLGGDSAAHPKGKPDGKGSASRNSRHSRREDSVRSTGRSGGRGSVRRSYLATDDEEEEQEEEGEEDRSSVSSQQDPDPNTHTRTHTHVHTLDTSPRIPPRVSNDKYPRSRPLLSSTPPRRPHYTLPRGPSSEGVTSSYIGDRRSASDRNSIDRARDSYSNEHKIGGGAGGGIAGGSKTGA